jgi:hypothetical protein
MENVNLPIPVLTEGIIDMHIQALSDLGLRKDIAVFILGSLVYQTPNERGERKFNHYVEEVPNFELYKEYFIRHGILLKGKEESAYAYNHDLDCERYLEPYYFDSIIVRDIILKEFPNFSKSLENVFAFLKPNLHWDSLPF